MSFTGYRIYRGVGGLVDVDFSTPVAAVTGADASKALVGLGHAANTTYTYVLRAVYSDVEAPDVSAVVELVTDSEGDWLGNRPDPVTFLEAEVRASGEILLRWGYRTGGVAAADFGVYYLADPHLVIGTPDATESFTRDKTYTKTLSLVDGTAYWFAVTARTSGGVESAPIKIGPYIADATAPATPTLIAETTFQP